MKRTRIDCKGQTPEPVPTICLQSLYPNLDTVFAQLSHGEHPNVIEMMGAIEDLVVFSTEGDMNPRQQCSDVDFMSQKKCRFCD